mmetsp:Transcript_59709/g.187284  ORF Transcript_59709/g.187284 Transcript_59709/m.187284 type:complete len:150 (-) Transcript_59709:2-451(-)
MGLAPVALTKRAQLRENRAKPFMAETNQSAQKYPGPFALALRRARCTQEPSGGGASASGGCAAGHPGRLLPGARRAPAAGARLRSPTSGGPRGADPVEKAGPATSKAGARGREQAASAQAVARALGHRGRLLERRIGGGELPREAGRQR